MKKRLTVLLLALVMVISSAAGVMAAPTDFVNTETGISYSLLQAASSKSVVLKLASSPSAYRVLDSNGNAYSLKSILDLINDGLTYDQALVEAGPVEEPTGELKVVEVSAINNMSIEVTFEGIEEPVVIELETALVHGTNEVTFLHEEVEYTVTVNYVDPAVVAAEKAEAIKDAKEAINAIGNPVVLTLEDEAKVVYAEGLVDAAMLLGAVEEDFGTGSLDHLIAARDAINILKDALSARDLAYQNTWVAMINLPMAENITLAHKAQVEAAREAYDELLELAVGDLALTTDETEALNIWKLVAAEGKIAELLGDKEAADIAAADAVRLLILNTLVPVNDIKLADKDLAEAARAAYELLTDDQKALELLAPAYAHLEAVEEKILLIEDEVTEAEEAILAAQEKFVLINDVVEAEQFVEDAKAEVAEVDAIDADAFIEGEEWLVEADSILEAILVAVNNSDTQPGLLNKLVYFTDVNADLINKYREVLGTDHEVVSLTLVQGAIDRVNLENEGAVLLALLQAAPNQIVLLNLLNQNFPGIITDDLVNEYEVALNTLDTLATVTVEDIEEALEHVNALAAAEAAVEIAEASKTQEDVDAAQVLVTALPAGDQGPLQARLNAVQNIIDLAAAEYAVVAAEASEAQEDVDAAKVLVTALPAGAAQDDLQDRLDAVQNIIDLADVKALIAALPEVVTLADEDQVNEVKDKYDDLVLFGQLTIAEKAKLDDAVEQLDELLADKAAVEDDIVELISLMEGSATGLSSAPTITRNLNILGTNGSTITWGVLSSNAASISGSTLTLSFPNSGTSERTSTITATIEKGESSEEVNFTIETERYATGLISRAFRWSIAAN